MSLHEAITLSEKACSENTISRGRFKSNIVPSFRSEFKNI